MYNGQLPCCQACLAERATLASSTYDTAAYLNESFPILVEAAYAELDKGSCIHDVHTEREEGLKKCSISQINSTKNINLSIEGGHEKRRSSAMVAQSNGQHHTAEDGRRR